MDPTPDRIIRDTFEDKEDAIPFFRATLPSEVLSILDLDSLEAVQGTFIDENMKEYRTDVLFNIKTKHGSFSQIFFLFEHKSSQDKKIFPQLLSYLARIYEQQEKPVPVIPFVFYHSADNWKLGTEFQNLFKMTEEENHIFMKYLPNFQFKLFNLNTEDLESLNLTLYERTLFRIMLHIDRDDLPENIHDIFYLSYAYFFEEKKLEKLRKLLLYIFTRGDIPEEKVRTIFAAISTELEKEAMTTAERLRKEGMELGLEKGLEQGLERGIEQGLEQGILKGEQEILVKLVERRFGKLSSLESDMIYSCMDRSKLDRAGLALIENKSKENVLSEIN